MFFFLLSLARLHTLTTLIVTDNKYNNNLLEPFIIVHNSILYDAVLHAVFALLHGAARLVLILIVGILGAEAERAHARLQGSQAAVLAGGRAAQHVLHHLNTKAARIAASGREDAAAVSTTGRLRVGATI